jgi:hypothetical protein
VFDVCFTGDSDSSNDSSNKRMFSVHLAESKGIPIPRTYEEAMASKYWKEWKAAMDKEIQLILALHIILGRKLIPFLLDVKQRSHVGYTQLNTTEMVPLTYLRHVLSFAVTRNRPVLIMIARFMRRCEHPVFVHYLELHQL